MSLIFRSETYPYPCIRGFHHVSLFMSENDAFPHILKASQSARKPDAPLLLDIGCCSESSLPPCWTVRRNPFVNKWARICVT